MSRHWHIDQRAAKAAREYLGVGPQEITPEMEKLRDIITKHYDDINAFTLKEFMLKENFYPHDDEDAAAILRDIFKSARV